MWRLAVVSALLALLALPSCGTQSATDGDAPDGMGTLRVTIDWPAAGDAGVRAIPTRTSSVDLTISGSGFTDITRTVTASNVVSGQVDVLVHVPPGSDRSLLAEAFDTNTSLIADGLTEGLTITAGATTVADVRMASTQIAFANASNHVAYIYADGSNTVDVTVGTHPVWSPDGSMIAYHSGGNLCTANADGSNQTTVVALATTTGLSWSPDGSMIAYDDNTDIYRVNTDGTGNTSIQTGAISPSWSPDGDVIAYTLVAGGVWTMDTNGGSDVQVLASPANCAEWSPDGTQFVYTHAGDGIYVRASDGGGSETMLRVTGEYPSWSADGRRIAFYDSDGDQEIYVMFADGTGVSQVTLNITGDLNPRFRPLY